MKRALVGIVGGTVALALVAAVAVARLLPAGSVTYVDAPVVTLPLPEGSSERAPAPALSKVAMLAASEPDRGSGPPVAVDPTLQETASWGAVPSIAADGRTSLTHYSRPDSGGLHSPLYRGRHHRTWTGRQAHWARIGTPRSGRARLLNPTPRRPLGRRGHAPPGTRCCWRCPCSRSGSPRTIAAP